MGVPLAAAMVMKGGCFRDARAMLQRAQDGQSRVGSSNMPPSKRSGVGLEIILRVIVRNSAVKRANDR